MKSHRARNYETGTVPSAITFELGRTSNNAAVDDLHVRSGGSELLVCFSRRARAYSVQIKEVKRIAALLEISTRSSSDDTACDGLRVTLRGNREDIVGLVA